MDLTGQRFGRLMVIERAEDHVTPSGRRYVKWKCICDCGNVCFVRASGLRNGSTCSCGCLHKEISSQAFCGRANPHYMHGGRNDRLYMVWAGMNSRCYSEAHHAYKDYGGRGITVCAEWRNDYAAFRNWAMANGYDPEAPRGACTIDRIDVNGNYCPENCRWVTAILQEYTRKLKT